MNKIFADLPVTVFEAMSQLAPTTTPSILARAFPMIRARGHSPRAADAVMDGYNQYPR